MRNYVLKDVDHFLAIADIKETPMKFYQLDGNDVRAECNLKVAMVSFEGKKTEELMQRLREAGFAEVEIKETRPRVEV